MWNCYLYWPHNTIKSIFKIFLGLLGCYCPPIGNFMVAEKIPGMGMWKWLGFVDCCCPTFGIATCVLNMMLRDKIREKDGIEGSFCDDCLSASLCCPCSVCQTYHQVKMDGTEGISFDDRFKASCCLPCIPCYACLTYNMWNISQITINSNTIHFKEKIIAITS